MTDSILQKYRTRSSDDGANISPSESEPLDDFGSFGWLRGVRDRALMLELRLKTGNIVAIGYAWLERLEYDPSEGIALHLAGRTIRLRGQNLNAETRPNVRLFQGLTRQRVPWIQEADAAMVIADQGEGTVIESIEM